MNKTIQRIKDKGLVLKDRPKTKSSFRTLALSRVTVDAIRQHLADQEQ